MASKYSSFRIQTDANSAFQQLRKYIELIALEYKNTNPLIHQNLIKILMLQPENISQRNYPQYGKHESMMIEGNNVKIMPLANQLTRLSIRQENSSNADIYQKLIGHIKSHLLFECEESHQKMEPVQEKIKENQSLYDNISQDFPKKKIELDRLARKWVNRSSSPHQNMSEFLRENYPYDFLSISAFKSHLKDAYKRGIIDKDPKTGRYKPKPRS
jgi:hypothetical protein